MSWLSGYQYRKQIPIAGQAGAGTNYQVRMEVHSGAGEDSDGVVYLSGHCQDFPNDIRFTDDDGMTELDYWIEPGSGTPRYFWVEVADNLDDAQDFYIYYGNETADSESSAPATFIVGDDFEDVDFTIAAPQDQIHDTWYGAGYVWACTRDDNDIGSGGYLMRYEPDGTVTTKQFAAGEDRIMVGCYAFGYIWLALLTSPAKLLKVNPADMDDYVAYTMEEDEDNATSVCSDGTYIWMSLNTAPGKLIKFDPSTGLHTTYTGTANDNRFYWILWDSTYVWAVGSVTDDPQTSDGRLVRFTPSTEALKGYTIGASLSHYRPHHIAYDGAYVWVSFSTSPGKYIKWNIAGESYDSYSLPSGKNDAYLIEYNDGWLWLTTFGTSPNDELYKIDPSDGSYTYVMNVVVRPHGICFDNKNRCWLGNYRYPTAGALIQRISFPAAAFPVAELTFAKSGTSALSPVAGLAHIELGTSTADAGILVTTDSLASKNFAARNRMQLTSIQSGTWGYFLVLAQRAARPICGTITAEAGYRRIIIRQTSTGAIQIVYWDSNSVVRWWNGTSWSTTESTAYAGAASTYYIAKLISTATNWKVRLEDDDGSLLTETTSIDWSATKDDSNPLWLYWHDPFTDYFYGDSDTKEFFMRKYVEPEPSVGTAGPEEEYAPLIRVYGPAVAQV